MSTPLILVGAGNVCRLWLPVVAGLPEFELRALVDVDEPKAHAILAEFGVRAPVETDIARAIARHRPRIVVDLTPPSNRLVTAAAAFAGGCDVICEKPLAESLRAARELVALAEASGRRLAVMQNHRFHPALQALRAAVAAGELGDVFAIDCELQRSVEAFDRVADMDSPLLADMAIHAFDGARALSGREPRRVLAHELRPAGSAFAGATVASCLFELSGGVRFTYRGSWSAAGLETPWFGDWRIDGTEAAAQWRDDGAPVIDPGDRTLNAGGPNDHPAAVPALLAQMASGRPLETSASDNIRSLTMVLGAVESARTGNWVEL